MAKIGENPRSVTETQKEQSFKKKWSVSSVKCCLKIKEDKGQIIGYWKYNSPPLPAVLFSILSSYLWSTAVGK